MVSITAKHEEEQIYMDSHIWELHKHHYFTRCGRCGIIAYTATTINGTYVVGVNHARLTCNQLVMINVLT